MDLAEIRRLVVIAMFADDVLMSKLVLPGYALQTTPRPRAQDFYDIHVIVTKTKLDLATAENLGLLQNIFAAKEVPTSFLGRLREQKSLHLPDWPSVVSTTLDAPKDFDFYFEFIANLAEQLEAALRIK